MCISSILVLVLNFLSLELIFTLLAELLSTTISSSISQVNLFLSFGKVFKLRFKRLSFDGEVNEKKQS